jgi:hypothetical protein
MPEITKTDVVRYIKENPKSRSILGYFYPQVLDGAQGNLDKGKPLI